MKLLKSIFVCALLGAAFAFAGPFGLSQGMTLEQVKKACGGKEPVKLKDGSYSIEPQKKHSRFERYFAWIDAEKGLHYVQAVGPILKVKDNGFELRGAFGLIEGALEKTYGKGERVDSISVNSLQTFEMCWMKTLYEKERFLQCEWKRDFGSKLPDDLTSIFLFAGASGFNEGYLVLEYEFSNHGSVANADDGVL